MVLIENVNFLGVFLVFSLFILCTGMHAIAIKLNEKYVLEKLWLNYLSIIIFVTQMFVLLHVMTILFLSFKL